MTRTNDRTGSILKIVLDGLAGCNPAELALRERTGCSVVAVERSDEVIVDLGSGFWFQPEDAVYICGGNNALRRFREAFGRG